MAGMQGWAQEAPTYKISASEFAINSHCLLDTWFKPCLTMFTKHQILCLIWLMALYSWWRGSMSSDPKLAAQTHPEHLVSGIPEIIDPTHRMYVLWWGSSAHKINWLLFKKTDKNPLSKWKTHSHSICCATINGFINVSQKEVCALVS